MKNKIKTTAVLGQGFIASHFSYKNYYYTGEHDLLNLIRAENVDCVINAIGSCGVPNIDACEDNKLKTYIANTKVALDVASVCQQKSVYLINISSGCIFNGQSPNIKGKTDTGWKEDDIANPQSYYSKTKYATDLVLGNLEHCASLRIRMPISDKQSPRNLISKLIGYDKVLSEPNSITMLPDFVKCVEWFVKNRPSGIFHITNSKPLTAARVMEEYQKYVPTHKFVRIDANQLDKMTKAKRSNCILDNSKLTNAGFIMSDTEEALEKCMKAYCEMKS